jgi:TPR repeat protein
MHQHGVGVKRDFLEMVRLYRLAAVRKHAPAQCCLGDAYLLGQGVPVDHDEAKRWFRLAADQGDDIARERLDQHRQWGTRRYCFDIQEGVAEVGAMSVEGIAKMAARYSAYINGTDRAAFGVKTSW